MLFGCHVRVSGGHANAARYAAEVGCECMQVFAKSPRMWAGSPIDPVSAEESRVLRGQLGLEPLFVHTAYLINLGSADDVLWRRSIDALADELARAAVLGATGVVTHIGTRRSVDLDASAARVAGAIAEAYAQAPPGAPRLLLENSAGAGTAFGGEFAEIGRTLERLDELGVPNAGVCLDTCHAHAHGIDLSSAEAWGGALAELDATCGIGRLGLLHANDSMFPCGSHRDRHAWIGDGTIGYDGFAAMVSDPRLEPVPVVMEMPGEAPGKDIENLTRLRRLYRETRG